MTRKNTAFCLWFTISVVLLSGCAGVVIQAPGRDLVLAKGVGYSAAQMATSGQPPRYAQRQIGLLTLGMGTPLIHGNEFGLTLGNVIASDHEGVAFVSGYHFLDFLIGQITQNLLVTNKVRVYTDVK